MNFEQQPEENIENTPDNTSIGVMVGDLEVIETIDSDDDRELVKRNLDLYQRIDQADTDRAREIVNSYEASKWEVANELFYINRREKARYKNRKQAL